MTAVPASPDPKALGPFAEESVLPAHLDLCASEVLDVDNVDACGGYHQHVDVAVVAPCPEPTIQQEKDTLATATEDALGCLPLPVGALP